jgi:uncharacterized protein (TIGR00297 family)
VTPSPAPGIESFLDAAQRNLAAGIAVTAILAFLAWRAGTVRASGIAAGVLIGLWIYVAGGWRWFSVLAVFFIAGSALTKLGYPAKAARGLAESHSGRRGWQNAVANGGVGALCAGVWIFTLDPRAAAAFVASFATALFDTAGSEIGGLYGRSPISLKNFRRVPPGTEGAISLQGLAGGLVSAAALAAGGGLLGVIPFKAFTPVVLAAVLGGLYESLAAGVVPLRHSALNFTNTAVGALLAWLFVGG